MMQLHPFQLDTNRKVWRAFSQGATSVLIQAPTGSGKTVMGSHLIRMRREHAKEKAIVFAHRREIVRQTAEKLEMAGMVPEIIMAGHAPNPWATVQVASLDTVWARRGYGGFPEANFVVIDEAHLAGGKRYQELVQHYLSTGAKLLGLTATPIRNDCFGLGNLFQSMVRAPDVPWLIDNGFLCKPRYIVGRPVSTKGFGSGNEFNRDRVEAVMDTEELRGDIVESWMRFCRDRPTIIFSSGVKHSRHLVAKFESLGVRAEHVDGDTENEVRDNLFKASKNSEVQIISNAQVYIEGADFPWISCVVLGVITKSLVRYLQMGGRGLRTSPGKLDLMVLDHGGNWDRHGPLELARDWELSTDDKQQERLETKRKKEQRLSVRCPQCSLVHSLKVCPHCHAAPKESADVEFIQAMMAEVSIADWEHRKMRKSAKPNKLDNQEFYSSALGLALERGKSPGWAAHLYRSKMGVWPRGLAEIPQTPSGQVRRYEHSRRIAFARSKEKSDAR